MLWKNHNVRENQISLKHISHFLRKRHVTFSQTSPGFHMSSLEMDRKHWEKEKLLVTSNFSFSHSVFYPFGELFVISIKFEFVVGKLF